MNDRSAQKPNLSAFAGFAAMALFALCLLCVLLAGAGVYGRLAAAGQEDYVRRTAAHYVSTRVRQSDGSVTVEPFGENRALVFSEKIENESYLTYLYVYEGWLMELFSAQNSDFSPEDGEKLLQIGGFFCRLQGERLDVTLTDQLGRRTELTFALPGREVQP